MIITNSTRKMLICLALASLCAIWLSSCKAEQTNALDNNSKATHSNGDKRPTPANQPDTKGEVQVVIQNFAFAPSEITVEPGTKVTWTNKDDAPHTATSVNDKFNSGGLDTNDTYSFVFKDKGDYQYFCTLHPQMKAIIKVK